MPIADVGSGFGLLSNKNENHSVNPDDHDKKAHDRPQRCGIHSGITLARQSPGGADLLYERARQPENGKRNECGAKDLQTLGIGVYCPSCERVARFANSKAEADHGNCRTEPSDERAVGRPQGSISCPTGALRRHRGPLLRQFVRDTSISFIADHR